jgi:hypothetical protein
VLPLVEQPRLVCEFWLHGSLTSVQDLQTNIQAAFLAAKEDDSSTGGVSFSPCEKTVGFKQKECQTWSWENSSSVEEASARFVQNEYAATPGRGRVGARNLKATSPEQARDGLRAAKLPF